MIWDKVVKERIELIFKKYLVTALPSGLMIINQKRAHQRIIYEKLLSNLSLKKTQSQSVLFPFNVSTNAQEVIFFNQNKKILQAMGFEFKIDKSSEIINFTSIPVLFDKNQLENLFDNLFSNEIKYNGFSQADSVSKQLSKAMAIPNGKILSIDEQHELLASLFACKEKNLSPFNRPILVNLDESEINKKIN